MNEGPKYGLHGIKEDIYQKMRNMAVPGPGSYQPDTKQIFERAASPQYI